MPEPAAQPDPSPATTEPDGDLPPDDKAVLIVEERPARRHALLYKPPVVRINVALVMLSPKGTYRVALPDSQPTLGELTWRRIRTLYEVDLGEHGSLIEDDVPSAGDAFCFHAAVDLRWRIQDPAGVVRRHLATVGGVEGALRPELLDRIRTVTREFDVIDSADAETKVNRALAAEPIGEELGLWTRCWVRLALEEAARGHAAARREVQRQIVLEQETHMLRRLQEQHYRELVTSQVEFYRLIITAGDIEQFAVRIAQKPGDIGAVMEALRDDRNTSRRDAVDFVARLAGSGLIERHQISDTIREMVEWLNESQSRVLDNSTAPRIVQRVPRPVDLPAPPLSDGATLPGSEPRRVGEPQPGEQPDSRGDPRG